MITNLALTSKSSLLNNLSIYDQVSAKWKSFIGILIEYIFQYNSMKLEDLTRFG